MPLISRRGCVVLALLWDRVFTAEVMPAAQSNLTKFVEYQRMIIKDHLPALPVYTKVYGSIFQTAYYFIDIFLGAPKPQEFSMIVDTGSSTQGLPCSNCRSCGNQHWEKPYIIEDSDFNERVPCGQCTTCRLTTDKNLLREVAEPLMSLDPASSKFSTEASKLLLNNPDAMQCLYNVHYAEGSRLQGLFYTDVLWLNMDKVKHKKLEIREPEEDNHGECPAFPLQPGPSLPIIVPVGCHVEETHLFHDQKASGILGLEFWGTRGITTFPTSILNDLETMYNGDSDMSVSDCGEKVADESTTPKFQYEFSLCLAPKGGSLSFGGSHSRYRAPEHTVKTIPLLSHSWRSQSYTVGMTNIAVLKNATLSPNIHSPAYFSLLKNSTMWIDIPINHPSHVSAKGSRKSVMPTLIDSGTTLTYMPPRLFGELLFHIENRVAVNTGIRDKQKLLMSAHRSLERVEPATLFRSSDVNVIVRDRFMTRSERGRSSHLEFIPVATALVSTGPKRLVRVSSTIADSQGRLLLDQLNAKGGPDWADLSRRRLAEESPPGWYAVLEPSADPANEPLDSLVGFLDVPLDMEAAAPRALISKLDGYNNGECWWLQDPQKDLPMFPILKFTFYPEQDVFWHPLSYMYSGSNQHFWCLAMMTDAGRGATGDDSLDSEAIFGSNSFIYQDITFKHQGRPAAIESEDDAHDLGKHAGEYRLHDKAIVEFAEADCPSIAIEK